MKDWNESIFYPPFQAAELEVYDQYARELNSNFQNLRQRIDEILKRPGVCEYFKVSSLKSFCCISMLTKNAQVIWSQILLLPSDF